MNRYETIFIADPDLSEDARAALFERLRGLIEGNGGYIAAFDEWGLRKLAYVVKKKKRGYYVLLDYCAAGPHVQELERILRIDDRVIRYLTITIGEDVDIDALRLELERAREEAERKREEAKKAAEEATAAAQVQAEAARVAAEAAQSQEAPEPEAEAAAAQAPEVVEPAAEPEVEPATEQEETTEEAPAAEEAADESKEE